MSDTFTLERNCQRVSGGLKLGLLHNRWILHPLSLQGSHQEESRKIIPEGSLLSPSLIHELSTACHPSDCPRQVYRQLE